MSYTIRPLDASTWAAFAGLAERNNGIFGGCWCIGYHPEAGQPGISYRAVKQERVRTGRAHAALVLDEDGAAQGWCQYGSPGELPGIKHKRAYDQDAPPRPDWRITCVFVDRKHADRVDLCGRGACLPGSLSWASPGMQRARTRSRRWYESGVPGRRGRRPGGPARS